MSYDPHSAAYLKEIEQLKAENARMRPVVDAAIARSNAIAIGLWRTYRYAELHDAEAVAVAEYLKERG